MKSNLKYISFLLLIFCYLACNESFKEIRHNESEQSFPNIIIIMADDLGYETINANGGTSYKTPNIDQLAANGMRFEHCYSQPLCTPSRVKIMTGIYNVRNYVEFGILDESQTTFGHLFKQAGYATCIVGKWQLGKDLRSPNKAGFNEYCLWQVSKSRTDLNGRDTRFQAPVLEINGAVKTFDKSDFGPKIVSEYGMKFMEKAVKANQPFLLYYPMILTHCPFSPTPESSEWGKDTSTIMTYKGESHYFEDMMAYTDYIIGNIQQKLINLGIQENTLILFTGDNGTDKPVVSILNGQEVAGAKGKSTDAGTRVPLIVQWPKSIQANQTCSDLVDFSDILPTICEAANINVPVELDIDGQSFLPQLKGQKGHPREWVYNWYSRSGAADKARVFARNQRYKLYQNREFYEIPIDNKEEFPKNIKTLTPQEKINFDELGKVLESYKNKRLEKIIK